MDTNRLASGNPGGGEIGRFRPALLGGQFADLRSSLQAGVGRCAGPAPSSPEVSDTCLGRYFNLNNGRTQAMQLKVGELAQRTGLTVRTLHHFDQIVACRTAAERLRADPRLDELCRQLMQAPGDKFNVVRA